MPPRPAGFAERRPSPYRAPALSRAAFLAALLSEGDHSTRDLARRCRRDPAGATRTRDLPDGFAALPVICVQPPDANFCP